MRARGAPREEAALDIVQVVRVLEEIGRAGPTEDVFSANIHLLCVLLYGYVQAEEKPRGAFAAVRQSSVDSTCWLAG